MQSGVMCCKLEIYKVWSEMELFRHWTIDIYIKEYITSQNMSYTLLL